MANEELLHLKSLKIEYAGENVLLGSAIGINSMNLGYYYMDKKNAMYELLDEAFSKKLGFNESFVALRNEYILNSKKRKDIARKITCLLNKLNLRLEDIIHEHISRSGSKDTAIKRKNIKEYNKNLFQFLESKTGKIFVNGKNQIKFLKWFLQDEHKMTPKESSDYISRKVSENKLVFLESSSGANNKHKELRRHQWECLGQ